MNRKNAWKNEKLAETLLQGKIAVMPTDTIYGIVAKAENREAVERVYAARGRDSRKPCIILIGEEEQLEKFSIALSEKQKAELGKYWPGPISIVFNCPAENLEYLHRGTKSLAFRLPANLMLRELLLKAGPLVAPSANTEGAAPARTIAEAEKYFGDSVDFYADGGTLEGAPSRVVKLNADGRADIIR